MSSPDGDARVDAATFHRMLRSRRTIRRYTADVPPRETLERLFAAAIAAPSAHNRQPWRFLAIVASDAKAALADAMGARLQADRTRDGDDPDDIARDVARSKARITGAPVAVLVALSLADMDDYPDAARAEAEFLMAVQSTAMAAQNLLLAAHAEGLGGCWMCAPLFCPDTVRAVLDLPPDWIPQGLVTLGHPAGEGKHRPRKPLEEVVRFR